MSGFDDTRWSEKEFSKDFRDSADGFIPERATLIRTALSYYEFFIKDGKAKRVLDLGCGDGIITERLIESDSNVEQAILVDASSEMLGAAKERLKGFNGVEFIESTFEDMMADGGLTAKGPFDFVLSSLAIHHLTMKDKAALFDYIYSLLKANGAFINIDVVLGPTDEVDDWYLSDWCDWLRARGVNVDGDEEDDTFVRPKRCKDIPGNKPDTLGDQIEALKKSGFKEVDCFYKIGTFTAFGGRNI